MPTENELSFWRKQPQNIWTLFRFDVKPERCTTPDGAGTVVEYEFCGRWLRYGVVLDNNKYSRPVSYYHDTVITDYPFQYML